MIVAVTGGRKWKPTPEWHGAVWSTALEELLRKKNVTQLHHGGCSGADLFCASVANVVPGVRVVEHRADWKKHGKAAGPIRNRKMLKESTADVLLAFPGGRGTHHCKSVAIELGIPRVMPFLQEVGGKCHVTWYYQE